MNKRYVIAWIAAVAAGSALHFLYDLAPNPLTALVSPINESVWEHLKLLFWPTLCAAFVLSLGTKKKTQLWAGFFLAQLVMPLFLLCSYYLLKCAFHVQALALDLALYYVSMAGGFFLAYHAARWKTVQRAAAWLLFPLMLYGAALILFTFAAPPLPIFLPPKA